MGRQSQPYDPKAPYPAQTQSPALWCAKVSERGWGLSQHRWTKGGEDMPIRRGEAYLESLRDGRRLWLMGQPVEDVTTHPALAGCARSVAIVFQKNNCTACCLLSDPSLDTKLFHHTNHFGGIQQILLKRTHNRCS